MKRFVIAFFLGIVTGCFILGCQKKEESNSSADLEPASGTPDLYFLEGLSSRLFLAPYKITQDKPMTMDNFKLLIAAAYPDDDYPDVVPDIDSYPALGIGTDQEKEYFAYLRKISDMLIRAKETAPISYHMWQEPVFLGGVVSSPTITADKALFGHPAGDNLLDYFQACETRKEMHYQFWYPDYTLKGFNPSVTVDMPMSEIYSPGTMLLPSCYFRFKEIPTEKYDSITLTIEIPIQGESSIWFLPDVDPSAAKVDAILSGSITISFNE